MLTEFRPPLVRPMQREEPPSRRLDAVRWTLGSVLSIITKSGAPAEATSSQKYD